MGDDTRSRPSVYPRIETHGANIYFRRVPHKLVFFKWHTESLSKAYDEAYDEACFAPGQQPRHNAPCGAGR